VRGEWCSVPEAAELAGFGSVNYFRIRHCDPENPSFLLRVRPNRLRIRIDVNVPSLLAWIEAQSRPPRK
jgi:hypothetical protein